MQGAGVRAEQGRAEWHVSSGGDAERDKLAVHVPHQACRQRAAQSPPCSSQLAEVLSDVFTQTPSTGLRHPSFGGRCRKAMLGVWSSLPRAHTASHTSFTGPSPERPATDLKIENLTVLQLVHSGSSSSGVSMAHTDTIRGSQSAY